MMEIDLYRSVLKKLSNLPVEYLQQIDDFLSSIKTRIKKKEENRKAIMAMAGSWSDWENEEFDDYLKHAKETGASLFNREIDL
jgi:hypothetical protein